MTLDEWMTSLERCERVYLPALFGTEVHYVPVSPFDVAAILRDAVCDLDAEVSGIEAQTYAGDLVMMPSEVAEPVDDRPMLLGQAVEPIGTRCRPDARRRRWWRLGLFGGGLAAGWLVSDLLESLLLPNHNAFELFTLIGAAGRLIP